MKTQFGYHIMQMEEKKTAHLRADLAEVKAEIVPVLEQQRAGAAEQTFASSAGGGGEEERSGEGCGGEGSACGDDGLCCQGRGDCRAGGWCSRC